MLWLRLQMMASTPFMGPRPLKRAIQEQLLNPLSTALLEGNYAEGDTLAAELRHGQVEIVMAKN